MGYAHELGYNGVCDNCGLKLPIKYLFPDYSLQTSKKASEPIIDTAELISDLQAQGVNVTPEFFQEVLDTSHKNYIVPVVPLVEVPATSKLLARLGDLNPVPIENWRTLLSELIVKLTSLAKDANETEVALAYGPISDVASEAKEFIKNRMGTKQFAVVLDKWLKMDTKLLAEVVITYIVTPLQRIISKYDVSSLKVTYFYDLEFGQTIELKDMLASHSEVIKKFAGSFESGIGRAKIQHFLEQIRGLLTFANDIQPSRVPGGEIGTEHLREILLLGPLQELLNFNISPLGGDVAESLVDKSGSTLLSFLRTNVEKFTKESLSYSPEEIKIRIAKAKEKEKMNIIEDFDVLDEDAKRVALLNKRLGIGRWAQGTEPHKYDPEQVEREREERIRKGGTDFGDVGGNVFELTASAEGLAEQQGGFEVEQESPEDL